MKGKLVVVAIPYGTGKGEVGIIDGGKDELSEGPNAYGVDGNGDGVIDLFNSQDAIPSAANYLIAHGWKNNPKKALACTAQSPNTSQPVLQKSG